jgi:hypothetical protein
LVWNSQTVDFLQICFTYPDASWVCKEPKEPRDCDR